MRAALLIAACAALLGCASMTSSVEDRAMAPTDGLVYHMPMRAIRFVVTVDKDRNEIPSVEAGADEPDLQQRFILSYDQNWVGQNRLKVTSNSLGLLVSTDSETTSGVGEILRNLGRLAGNLAGVGVRTDRGQRADVPPQCEANRTYVVRLVPGQTTEGTLCGFTATIVQVMGGAAGPLAANTPRARPDGAPHAGIFYRRDIPYVVTVTHPRIAPTSFLAFSPNESPTFFYPVSRTLFSNNRTTLSFSSPGILTSVEQSTDGELVAAASLPADILKAYFEAIGAVFTQLGNNSRSEATAVANAQAVALARAQLQACAAVIAANPVTNRTPEEASAAMAAIQAACR